MIVLNLLYFIAAFEIMYIQYLFILRLSIGVGDKKINNVFNPELIKRKNLLLKKIKKNSVIFMVTVILLFLYRIYAVQIIKTVGDMVSPLWNKYGR